LVSREESVTSVRDSRDEKQLEDRARWLFLALGLPLICFAIVRESLISLVVLQIYLLTGTAAGFLLIRHRLVLQQEWFRKAMACSFPIHILAATVIFYWDKANIEVAHKGFYAIGIVWLVAIVEMCCIVGIMELWKPRAEKRQRI
jgi:Na+/proline symporter